MFPLCPSIRRALGGQVPTSTSAVSDQDSLAGAVLRLGLLLVPLAAGRPEVASAQALGTMQVTARVLPGGPGWSGLEQAQSLARLVLSRPSGVPEVRRAGLIQAQAAIVSPGGPRRLLITIDYPRN